MFRNLQNLGNVEVSSKCNIVRMSRICKALTAPKTHRIVQFVEILNNYII